MFRRSSRRFNTFGAAIGWYNDVTLRRPLLSISLSTGTVLGLGDVLMQKLEQNQLENVECRHPDGSILPSAQVSGKIDISRVGRMFVFGAGIFGPFCTLWYTRFLPWVVPVAEGARLTRLQIAQKVLLDETIQSWYYYVTFLYSMSRMEGRSHGDAINKLKRDFFRCYLADLCVWPLIQTVNFAYVPPHMQSLVVSCVSVVWGMYLSYVQNSDVAAAEAPTNDERE